MADATLAAIPSITRRPEQLLSDDKRVITRLFVLNPERTRSILGRALMLKEADVHTQLQQAMKKFSWRHRNLPEALRRHCRHIAHETDTPVDSLSDERKLLIGAYFSLEYSIESAALFNPSIVPHPDQSNLAPGHQRFLLSLRATGEGHLSSIVFRAGQIDSRGKLTFGAPPRFADWARPQPYAAYDKRDFVRKLLRIQPHLGLVRQIVDQLPDPFTWRDLHAALERIAKSPDRPGGFEQVASDVYWLASAHYELNFEPDLPPEERVIFPATSHESLGMEDLRLVRFIDEHGQCTYYGTYTAFDGQRMLPMLIETADFKHFHISPLSGQFAQNKGLALFPRKVNGQYLMIARHDGENLYLLQSDDVRFWNHSALLQRPIESWELVQIGNAGSPIETDAGWILLTHGVGPMREYGIGAMLLARDDPRQVLGRLRQPLLLPTAEEREGYVPNVVYSCGSVLQGQQLIIPYAISDQATTFATVDVDDLIHALVAAGP